MGKSLPLFLIFLRSPFFCFSPSSRSATSLPRRSSKGIKNAVAPVKYRRCFCVQGNSQFPNWNPISHTCGKRFNYFERFPPSPFRSWEIAASKQGTFMQRSPPQGEKGGKGGVGQLSQFRCLPKSVLGCHFLPPRPTSFLFPCYFNVGILTLRKKVLICCWERRKNVQHAKPILLGDNRGGGRRNIF